MNGPVDGGAHASQEAPLPIRANWNAQAAGLLVGFILFLAGLGGAFYFSVRNEGARANARHSLDVQTTTHQLLSALVEAESSQRGYLLTHDDRYLEPYFVSRVTLQAIEQNLATLVRADTATSARVAALAPLIGAKIGEMEQTVALEQRGAHARAMELVVNDQGRRLMIDLRTAASAIADDAGRTLAVRRGALDRIALALRVDILATLVLGLVLVGLIARTRSRLLRDLARQNVMLEERVRERTAALETRTKRVETLMQDMSHRIGNALSLVTGFLDLQARASKSEEVKTALAAARQRVFSIASAQRRMRLAMDSDSVETIGFFDTLIEDFRNALPDHRISILADIQPSALPSQDASAFGVILNELIANAIKHAWQPSDQGELNVRFAVENGERVLSVADDGRGHLREDRSGGLGQILVQSLVQSLRGTMTASPVSDDPERPGLRCMVRAPA